MRPRSPALQSIRSAAGGEHNLNLRIRASRERMRWSASLRGLYQLYFYAYRYVSPRRKDRGLGASRRTSQRVSASHFCFSARNASENNNAPGSHRQAGGVHSVYQPYNNGALFLAWSSRLLLLSVNAASTLL